MKEHPTAYWISTGLVSAMMLLAAAFYLMRSPQIMATFAHLGYPPYFVSLLAVAKILGVCVLIAPRFSRLKEWAYAGFTITFISAFISHLESGDGAKALIPIVALIILMVSYATRPISRTALPALPVYHDTLHPGLTTAAAHH
jgi:uncharacterized membrane protein YphA (DoxX/SURF4 family)